MLRAFVLSAALGVLAVLAPAQTIVCVRTPAMANSIDIYWTPPVAAVAPITYTLFAAPSHPGPYALIATTPATTFTDLTLSPSCVECYYVVMTDFFGTVFNSDTCGYKIITATGGAGAVSTSYSIKFLTWDVAATGIPIWGVPSTSPSDILRDQANCGTINAADRILSQCSGAFAYRSVTAGCAWSGILETTTGMIDNCCYWYTNKTGVNRTIIQYGDADVVTPQVAVSIIAPVTAGATVSIPYSWRDPRQRARNNLQLMTQGFLGGTITSSDRVLSQCGGAFFYFRTSDLTWQGTLVAIDPCDCCFWIQNKHVGNTYSYVYNPTSNLP